MHYALKIQNLDIQQSYFVGKATLGRMSYTVNIQGEGRLGKAILFPFEAPQHPVLVRLSGPNMFVEEFLTYGGRSEWIEIDSNSITSYVADHQDEFDYLEIYPDSGE